MKTRINIQSPSISRILMLLCFTLLAAVFTSSCGNSSLSSETIDDPTSIPALFAVGRIDDASSGRTEVVASAVFGGEGLTTVRFLDGTVELEDPWGNIHPLELDYNRLGAPFYSTTLEEDLQLDAFYSFRVTLANGRLIENSIKTPAQPLQIFSPTSGEKILKTVPMDMQWSGWNNRAACIHMGPESPTLLDVFDVGGKLTEDDGHTSLLPESMQHVGSGQIRLSLARFNQVRANGFHPNSSVGAVLLTSQPITVE